MKTLFSSQDDIFTKFNGILIYVWIVWKSVFFYLNRRHTLSTNNGDARVARASDFKGKIRSQQIKNLKNYYWLIIIV